jgi:hypothetical protein
MEFLCFLFICFHSPIIVSVNVLGVSPNLVWEVKIIEFLRTCVFSLYFNLVFEGLVYPFHSGCYSFV